MQMYDILPVIVAAFIVAICFVVPVACVRWLNRPYR